jgi:endonuclease YncB( thermonuclease family)
MKNEVLKKSICTSLLIVLTSLQILNATAQSDERNFYGYGYGYSMTLSSPLPEELLINEFMSRPASGDSEWIELYNTTQKLLSLEGCELSDAVGRITEFDTEAVLFPTQHLLYELSRNKLNNSGDTIMISCDEQVIDEIKYGNRSDSPRYSTPLGYEQQRGYLPAPGVAKSLARFPDGSSTWFVFGSPTPGVANEVENQSPQAVIRLQGAKKTSGCDSLSVNVTGEDSTDPDGDPLSYSWEYRESLSGRILQSTDRENPLSFKFLSNMGEQFEIHLKVSDPFGGISESKIPINLNQCATPKVASSDEPQASSFQLSSSLLINELLPNPSGKDSGNEYIELYNSGSVPIRLEGWKLGGKTKKKLDGHIIEPFDFLIFKNITLRNSGDSIRLIDPNRSVQSEVTYEEAKDDQSWSRHPSGSFKWTIPTPGIKNDFPFQTETIYLQADSALIITQFLPNPKGKDDGNEWVEIMNRSDQELDLSDYKMDNRDGGSRPHTLSGKLKSQDSIRLSSSETKITLRNSADQVRILDASGQVLDLLEWSSPAPDGRIFKRNQLIRDLSIEPDIVRVVNVVDGDTIDVEVNGEIERVRLIGVDTPETVHPFKALEHFGKEASNFTRRQLEGKEIRLEYDLSKRGKYGRLLAYVWIGDEHFNAKLIEEGYAFAYLRYPFKYREQFRKLELQAEQEGLGLWQSEDIQSIREQQELVIDEEMEELEIIEEILQELEEEPEEIPEEEQEKISDKPPALIYDQTGWDQILLNEILPNPKGKDSDGGEFIELLNLHPQPIDLAGWHIQNSKGKIIWKFDGDSLNVRTGRDLSVPQINQILLIHPKSPIKNSSDTLSLIDPLGQIRDSFTYDQSMKDDQVWARHPETLAWHLLITATPGEINPSDIFAHQTKPKKKKQRKKSGKKIKPLYQIIQKPQPLSTGLRLFPFARAASSSSPRKDKEPLYLGGFLSLVLLAFLILQRYLGIVRSEE